MRVVILQNGLESRSTHYFNESAAWRAALGARGLTCRIYANRKAAGDILADLGATACFAYGTDIALRFEPETQALHTLVSKTERFASDCRMLDVDGIGGDDLVVLPYAGGPEMAGLGRWLELRPAARRPRVVALHHRPGDDWVFDDARERVTGGFTAPVRYGAQRLMLAAGEGRLMLAATSERLAALLTAVTGIPTARLPLLWRYGMAEATNGAPTVFRGQRFDIGVLGEFRAEKGARLVVEGLRRAFAARPRLSVLIQMRNEGQAREMQGDLAGLQGRGGVTLLVGELGATAFEEAIGACRLLLLPYDPRRYVGRISGLFAEAAAWGRPVVAPAATWMGEMVTAGRAAGVLFDRYAAEDLGRALVGALDTLDDLTERASAVAPAWRRSETIDRAIDEILAWSGQP